MQNIISPVGLKGNQINERIKQLITALTPITEQVSNSVVELTKVGPDGNVYGIVRENHQYFIKVTAKKDNLISEDFKYIGGLQNKTSEAYPSYAKAIKHLNIKFNSLAEAVGAVNTINVFENDGATAGGFQQYQGNGFTNEGNMEGNDPLVTEENDEDVEEEDVVEEDVELTEENQDIEDMMNEEDPCWKGYKQIGMKDKGGKEVPNCVPVSENKKLSVARIMNDMDSIIDGLTKKKNYRLI